MRRKMATFDSHHFTTESDDLCYKFRYRALVQFGDDTLAITCSFSAFKDMTQYRVPMYLEFPDNRNTPPVLVISSQIYRESSNAVLQLIEVPDTLRHAGLGTIIFSCWIKVLERIAADRNIQFSHIGGTVGDRGDFEPRFARKLYKKFDNHRCFGNRILLLDRKELRQGRIEYDIK